MMKSHAKSLYFFILLIFAIFSCLFFRWPISVDSSLYELLPLKSANIPDAINSKYSSLVNIIVESQSFDKAKVAANKFYDNLQKNDINNVVYHLPNNIMENAIKYAQVHQNSFLLEQDRNNILNKNTSKIVEDSINFISTSLIPPVVSIEKDPFSLVNKYAMSLAKTSTKWQVKDGVLWQKQNGMHYIYINIPVDTSNVDQLTVTIKKIQSCIPDENLDVSFHLSGSPLHTVNMYNKSKLEVTLISVIASAVSVILTFLLFKKSKFVLVVAINLLIAFMSGVLSLILFYNKIHILAFAFGASLIGICIDYSFHKIYTMSHPSNNKIKKELTYSFLTTLVCFIPLLFSSITLLKQISVFTIGGLIGTFIWISFLKLEYTAPIVENNNTKTLKRGHSIILLSLLSFLAIIGISKLNIQNDMSKFYKPDNKLQKNEELFYQLNDTSLSQMVIIKGDSINSVIETEEELRKKYDINGISVFLPSQKRQEENYELLKDLYDREAANIQNELGLEYIPTIGKKNIITIDKFIEAFGENLFNQFILKDNGIIWSIVPTLSKINELPDNVYLFSPQKTIKDTLDECAKETYISLIFSILLLLALIFVFYRKRTFIYILPSIMATIGALAIINTIHGAVTFFHLISLFIVIGLSIDYTIFHLEKNYEQNIKPVLFSFLSSVIGFGLLSIASFNIISAMGQTIALGLVLSYIISFILIKCTHKIHH